jgi:hypothetical protein
MRSRKSIFLSLVKRKVEVFVITRHPDGYQKSFFGRFEEEFGDINRFETDGELIEEIYARIHYYNYGRIHTAIKMPPAIYAQQLSDNLSRKRGT